MKAHIDEWRWLLLALASFVVGLRLEEHQQPGAHSGAHHAEGFSSAGRS